MRRERRAGGPTLPRCYRAVAVLQPAPRMLASNQSTERPPRRPPSPQEAVMGQPIPAQHPSVVLRSHFTLVRTLLVIAMAAVLALAAVVVILANDDDQISSATKATPAVQQPTPAGTRYDGGPEEGTRGAVASPPPANSRYDGGPEEGTRGAVASPPAANSRYDGGPDEGTRGPIRFEPNERAGGPTSLQ